MYSVKKCDIRKDIWEDCGVWEMNDVKLIVRGYHNNGLFYEKANSYTIYTVEEVSEG